MKSKIPLLVSMGLGLFAVLIVHLYVAKKESDLQAGSKPVSVYVALDNIQEMVRITGDMVQKIEVPDSFRQPEASENLDQIHGSVARVPIYKGAQLTRNVLITRRGTGLAMRVDPQRRAMAIAVNDVTGVAGLVRPDNRIDIYGTFKLDKNDHESVQSMLLLTNIKVLASEREMGTAALEDGISQEESKELERSGDGAKAKKDRDEYPKNITVSVTPQEAIKLITAQESGLLTVTLRAQFDESIADEAVQPLNTQDLIGREEKTVSQRVSRYEQIRGNEVSY